MLTIAISPNLGYGADEPLPYKHPGAEVLQAAYHLAHGYPGGIARLAVRIVVSPNTLTHKVNPLNATHHLTLAESVDMQVASGSAAILHAMAHVLGYVCTRATPDQADGDPVEGFLQFQAAQADYTRAAADALMRETPTPNEVRRVSAMAQDVLAAANHLLALLRGRMRPAAQGAA